MGYRVGSMGTLKVSFSKDMIDDVTAGVCKRRPGLPTGLYI